MMLPSYRRTIHVCDVILLCIVVKMKAEATIRRSRRHDDGKDVAVGIVETPDGRLGSYQRGTHTTPPIPSQVTTILHNSHRRPSPSPSRACFLQKIGKQIGSGGAGIVYKGTRINDGIATVFLP
jgi:hypothetical protein